MRTLALTDEERARGEWIRGMAAEGAPALDRLLPQLDDPSWVIRRAVVAALAAMGEPALPRLSALLREARDHEGRLAAVVDALVMSRGDADRCALELTRSDNPAVVCDGVQVLGRRQCAAAVPRLAELISHTDDNVALASIEALGRIGDDAAMTPLLAALEARNFFRSFPAIDVLGRSGNVRAVKPLLGMLGEPHYGVEAARALGRIGDPSALAPLASFLSRPGDAMVRAAANAICEINDRQTERFGAGVAMTTLFADAHRGVATQRIVQALNHADPAEEGALVRVLGMTGGDAAALALVDLLAADHVSAEIAAAALGRLGKAATPALLAGLRLADSDRRLMILPLLGHDPDVAEPVAECLLDPNPTVRALACDALARIGQTGVVPRLFSLLADVDARVTQSAVAAIQSLGVAETEGLALEAARSENLRVRRAGLRIVAYFGYLSAIDVLIEAMGDPDERIRDAAIFGLPYVDDPRAAQALLRAAAHPSARTRAAAMRAIGQAPRQGATITALRTGLHDPDAWVRYFACQALSRLKDVGSADMISALFADPAGHVRVAVVEALAQLRGAQALEALHRAAAGEDPDVQRAALLGLGHLKDPGSLPVLRGALTGPDPATRLVAASALAEYDLPEIAHDLGTALGDPDESVRSAGISLLALRAGPEATRELVGQLANRPIQPRIVAALSQPVEGRLEVLGAALRNATAEIAPLLVAALARARRPEATQILEDGFATQGSAVRRAIAQALAAMGTGNARLLLAHAASQDPDEEVRRISAAAAER